MRLVPAQNGTPTDVSVVLRCFLVLTALPVASSVSMVALAPSRRQCHGVNGSVVMSRMRWGVSLAGSVWTALVVAVVSGYYH